MKQRTKIIATITHFYTDEQLIQLYKNGVSVVRINFTHATPETAEDLMERINKLNKSGETHLAMLLDTKGPDIRTGMRDEPLEVEKGQIIKMGINEDTIDVKTDLFCDYANILSDVKVGQEIVIDSGLLLVDVTEIHGDYLLVKAKNNAKVTSKRHINLPWVKISLPSMIEKDKTDIEFWVKMGISYVAASFIRTGENVKEVRKFLDKHNGHHVKIISKVENQEALENLEDIVQNSDAVMVARWDLGIEIPIQTLPVYQKKIMDQCFVYGKPVIIATELLKSMVDHPSPTRAEVSDVYNSVIMRADAVMLSDETAIGKYPIWSVKTMQNIILEAEKTTNNKHKDFILQSDEEKEHLKKTLGRHALMLADELKAKAVIVFSFSGNLARYLSSYMPNQNVFSFTIDEKIDYSFWINYGIISEKIEKWGVHSSDNQNLAIERLKEQKEVKKWDYAIVIWERIVNGKVHQPQIRVVPVE